VLRTLFRLAQRQHYYPREIDPFDGIEFDYDDDSEIEIFAPDELSRLLRVARPELVPFLAIGAFAGLRHAEIARLDWSDIKADHIEVKKGKSKTRSRRLVPIQPNLQAWLASYRQRGGPVVPFASMSKQLVWLAEDTKQEGDRQNGKAAIPPLEWKHNAPRHSFISYRMAVLKDENAVALEAGNSPQMIFANYRELVTEDVAKIWFAIEPERPANITAMPAALAS
jgi:integrase